MNFPLKVGNYGELLDKDEKVLLIAGAALPSGAGGSKEGEANRDFIITAVNSYHLLRQAVKALLSDSSKENKEFAFWALRATDLNSELAS